MTCDSARYDLPPMPGSELGPGEIHRCGRCSRFHEGDCDGTGRRPVVRWELRTESGKTVEWDGIDGEDASRRYVDCHRAEKVVAWRRPTGQGTVTVLGRGTIEG